MATITSANSKLVFTIRSPAGVPIIGPFTAEGYAADDAFASETVDSAEVLMGVDGKMSGGKVPYITPLTITFQADSKTIPLMEAWVGAQNIQGDLLIADGLLALPGPQKAYAMVKGMLRRLTPLPAGRRVLQPMTYEIAWESCVPAPLPA